MNRADAHDIELRLRDIKRLTEELAVENSLVRGLRGCLPFFNTSDFNSSVALKIVTACVMIYSILSKQPPHAHKISLQNMKKAIISMNDLINGRLASLGTVSNEIYNEQTLEFISNITSLSNTVFDLASSTVFDLASLSNISKIYPIVEKEPDEIEAEKDDQEKFQDLFDAFIKECMVSGSRKHAIFSSLNAILDENDKSKLSIDVSCLFDDLSQSKRMVSANVLKVLSDQISPLSQVYSPRSVDEQINKTLTGPQLIDLLREEVKDTLHEESLIEFMKKEGTQSTLYIMSLTYTRESIRETNQITEEDIQTIRSMVKELHMYTYMIQDEDYKAEFKQHHFDLELFLLRHENNSRFIGKLSENELGNENYQFQGDLLDKLAKFIKISDLGVLASIDNAGPDPDNIRNEQRMCIDIDDHDPHPRSRLTS